MTSSETAQPGRDPRMRAADSERLISVAKRVTAAVRCAYCHDDLGELSTVCSACQTALHAECRAQLAKCPTLGCRESVFTLLAPQERLAPAASRPAFRRALANLVERHTSSYAAMETGVDDLRTFLAQMSDEGSTAASPARVTPRIPPVATSIAPPDATLLEPLTGIDEEERARRLSERQAEDRARALRALRDAGIDPEHEPLTPDGYGPRPPLAQFLGDLTHVTGQLLRLPFTTLAALVVLTLAFAPAFWLSLLTRGRARWNALDDAILELGETWYVEVSLAPFLLAAIAVVAIGGTAYPSPALAAKVGAGALAFFLPAIVSWYRRTVFRGPSAGR